MRKIFLSILVALFAAAALAAVAADDGAKGDDPAAAVEKILHTKIGQVLSVLKETGLSKDQKESRIMEIIEPVIDFDLMAKLTLGRKHWGKLSPRQQKEFVTLFVERLKRSYLDKTTLYSDQEVTYDPPVVTGNKVHASMNIVTDEKNIVVVYKFYKGGDTWKVYDVEVEGVSFVKSYMAQFDAILQNGTVDDLFAELRKPVKDGE